MLGTRRGRLPTSSAPREDGVWIYSVAMGRGGLANRRSRSRSPGPRRSWLAGRGPGRARSALAIATVVAILKRRAGDHLPDRAGNRHRAPTQGALAVPCRELLIESH